MFFEIDDLEDDLKNLMEKLNTFVYCMTFINYRWHPQWTYQLRVMTIQGASRIGIIGNDRMDCFRDHWKFSTTSTFSGISSLS